MSDNIINKFPSVRSRTQLSSTDIHLFPSTVKQAFKFVALETIHQQTASLSLRQVSGVCILNHQMFFLMWFITGENISTDNIYAGTKKYTGN